MKLQDSIFYIFHLTLFVALFWGVDSGVGQWELWGDTPLERKVHAYVVLAGLFTLPYAWLLKRRRLQLPLWLAMLGVFAAAVLSPTALQTDQVRYVWDGLVSLSGENPFSLAPEDHPNFGVFPGYQILNHPYLPTIYPAFSQWAFALATFFNPMLWNGYLGWEWAPLFLVDSGVQLEIGWKIFSGLLAALSLSMLRHRRWDLFFLHPLVLITWLGNSHVDSVMVAFLIVLFEGFRAGKRLSLPKEALALAAAIGSKWMPLLFLPLFFLRWLRHQGWKRSLLFLFGVFTVVGLPTFFYAVNSDGNFFTSPMIFARNWMFFGFVHHMLFDLGTALGLGDPAHFGRLTGLGLWLLSLLPLLYFLRKKRVSLRLSCFLIYGSLLVVFPTLHPWYFISFLFLGLPYLKSFPVVWAWPCLALVSKLYYRNNEDPTAFRYLVFIVVFSLLIQMVLRLKRQGSLPNSLEAST